MSRLAVLLPLFLLTLCALPAFAAPLPLVQDGASSYSIYIAPDAPSSVNVAATDLALHVKQATGAELPIADEPRSPMVCLGDNAASRRAGLSLDGIPLEGFRIATRGQDIHILGPDTADGALTPGGGTSTGTRNGVYAFLERFLGVRWLMPGEDGDFVPHVPNLSIPETDLADAPFFLNRRVPYTQESRPEVRAWWARQRLGWSLYLNHSHNWERPVPASRFDEHPDWFAMRDGVRVPPTGRFKLCVTNPGLVRAFADAAIAYFDQNPEATSFSLSPSDSGGYCECPDCKALYEVDPSGNRSVTPAILGFYNAVGKLVAEKYPDKLLAGYVYAAYVFPPKTPIRLEKNVFLVWAPSFDYGFTLYRPELQAQWESLAAQWTQVTRNISYYDLPNCVHNDLGAPNPPGLKILKSLYPRLKQAGMKGVYVYGNPAWGYAGPMNYLLAKLAWDPEADVDALFSEFCEKAYAEGADEMKRFFTLLDDATEQYFIAHPEETYVLSAGRTKDVYAAAFPEMERLYRAAQAKTTDPQAARRLEMLGTNLTVLHWNLRQMKLLAEPEKSSFYLADADFFSLVLASRKSLALAPTAAGARPASLRKNLSVSPGAIAGAEAAQPFLLRGDQHILLKPTSADAIRVTFSSVTSRGKLLTYSVYDPEGGEVAVGLVSAGATMELPGSKSAYYHLQITAGSATFSMAVDGACWAVDQSAGEQGLHFLGKVPPLYFEVPAGAATFRLQIEATPPGETALATLYSPTGREAASFDCTTRPVDRQAVNVLEGEAGFWRLVVRKADVGVIDDVWVSTGEGLSGYFSLAPEEALSVWERQ